MACDRIQPVSEGEFDELIGAAGRACGDCMMCCKLPQIKSEAVPGEVWKRTNTWCRFAESGVGCSIYGHPDRPKSCVEFYCAWRWATAFGPELRPDRCKAIIAPTPDGECMSLTVEPANFDIWRGPSPLSRVVHGLLHEIPYVAIDDGRRIHAVWKAGARHWAEAAGVVEHATVEIRTMTFDWDNPVRNGLLNDLL